jgi:hypothetical protein
MENMSRNHFDKDDFYVSVDIEAGGPIPLKHQLMSIGAVTYNHDLEEVSRFYINVDDFNRKIDDRTWNEFWTKFPDAYAATQVNQIDVAVAILKFHDYIESHDGKCRFVAKPTWFDYGWLRIYMMEYLNGDPFEMRVCDYAQQAYACGMKLAKVHNPFNHHALYDAVEQGEQFAIFMRELRIRRSGFYLSLIHI